MDFVNFIAAEILPLPEEIRWNALAARLAEPDLRIRIKYDTAHPDLVVICHGKETVEGSFLYHCSDGLILEKESLKPLCYSFDKMEEAIIDPVTGYVINTEINENPRLELSMEGTLIRLWRKSCGELMVSTNRCIDANRARWISPKSFRQLFMESMSDFDFNQIEAGFTYSFVLTHPENVKIVQYTEAKSYHIGTMKMETMEEIDHQLVGVDRVPRFSGEKEEMTNLLDALLRSNEIDMEGYILIDDKFRRQKFVSPAYQRIDELFGNTTNDLYRYFTLRKNPMHLHEFLRVFPQMTELFNLYEKNYRIIGNTIHRLYFMRYITRPRDESGNMIPVIIPDYLRWFIRELHNDYMNTHIQTNYQKVMFMLDMMDVKAQCHIYNHMVGMRNIPICLEEILLNHHITADPEIVGYEPVILPISPDVITLPEEVHTSEEEEATSSA